MILLAFKTDHGSLPGRSKVGRHVAVQAILFAAAMVGMPRRAVAQATSTPVHATSTPVHTTSTPVHATSAPVHATSARAPGNKPRRASHAPAFFPQANISLTFGATWGDSDYPVPLEGAFAFAARAELHVAWQRGGWGFGVYGEIADPGSYFEARWLGGGGVMILSPRLWYLGAAWSGGAYGRESETGAYPGLTSGLSVGLRPRVWYWDFVIAFRVDLRSAVGRDEKSVTVGIQLDLAGLFVLTMLAVNPTGWRRINR